MGFFSELKLKREIKKLEDMLEQNPTAEVYIRLAGIYAENNDDLNRAVEISEQGLSSFPGNKQLQDTYDSYNKKLLKQDIDVIEKKVFNFPSATLFSKLSEKYYKYGDMQKARKYAETCMKEYPDKCAPYIVLGKVFHQEGEIEASRKMYDKAIMLESYNYEALMEYGGLLEEAGDLHKALSMYKQILSFAPGDRDAQEKMNSLLTKVDDIPAPPSSETERIAAEEDGSLEMHLDEQESGKAAAHTGSQTGAPPIPEGPLPDAASIPPTEKPASSQAEQSSVMDNLMQLLENFKSVKGVQGAILIDNYGLIIAEAISNTVDSELLAAVLTSILRTIKQHAGHAGIGSFSNGFVETDNLNMHLYSIKDIELVLFSTAETRLGLLEMKVKNFIDTFLEIETQL